MDVVEYDHDQGNCHDDTLDQVGGGDRQKSSHNGVTYNNNGTHDHSHMIINAEQAGEQSSDSLKTGSGVRDKENQNHDSRDTHQDVLFIVKSSGKEIRNGDSIADYGVTAQPLGYNQPV